jgi:hypothetical protein
MNINTSIRFSSAILFAFLCLASARAQTPALPKVDAVPGNNPAFISAFNDNKNFGRDPFFPRSTRRTAAPVPVGPVTLQPGQLPAGMVLKGLSGTKDKPLAIINNYTFAEGEEAEVRVINQLYRVKVVEIKERAVMIQVNGTEPRELTLRQGVY